MFERKSALLRQRRGWLFWLRTVWAVDGLPFVMGAVFGAPEHWPGRVAFLVIVLYVAVIFALSRAWRRLPARSKGELRANEDALFLDGRVVVERKHVRVAYPLVEGGRVVVRFVRRRGVAAALDVDVDSMEEARTLLATMRLDGASSVAQWQMQRGLRRTGKSDYLRAIAALVAMIPLAGFVLFRSHDALPLKLLALCIYLGGAATFGLLLQASILDVSVGADGVRIKRLWSTRFIPFTDIAKVRTTETELVLALHDGSEIAMHHTFDERVSAGEERRDDVRKLAERIEEQLAAQRDAPKSSADVLTRGGRRAEVWLRDATAFQQHAATFRTNAIPTEDLWRIVEDASATPTARAGAALALRAELDDGARTRLRVAADACAAPQLRIALESVARADDDEALLRALDALEDEAPASLRKAVF